MRIITRSEQWLGDVVIRETGDIEALVEMAISNNVSITNRLNPNTSLSPIQPRSRRVMNYYNINEIHPATSLEQDIKRSGGIGQMTIKLTFIVSS